MDINDLRTAFTVLVILVFIGIVWWAYSAKQKASFEEAARLALDDDDTSGNSNAGHQHN